MMRSVLLLVAVCLLNTGCTIITLSHATERVPKIDRYDCLVRAWQTSDDLVVLVQARMSDSKTSKPYTLRVPLSLLEGDTAAAQNHPLRGRALGTRPPGLFVRTRHTPDMHGLPMRVLKRQAAEPGPAAPPSGSSEVEATSIVIRGLPPSDDDPGGEGPALFPAPPEDKGVAFIYQRAGVTDSPDARRIRIALEPESHQPKLLLLAAVPAAVVADLFIIPGYLIKSSF
jgi:hypothetical protein